jgi:hypothetical protein
LDISRRIDHQRGCRGSPNVTARRDIAVTLWLFTLATSSPGEQLLAISSTCPQEESRRNLLLQVPESRCACHRVHRRLCECELTEHPTLTVFQVFTRPQGSARVRQQLIPTDSKTPTPWRSSRQGVVVCGAVRWTTRRDGEIGRRRGLKIPRPVGHAGSSPAPGKPSTTPRARRAPRTRRSSAPPGAIPRRRACERMVPSGIARWRSWTR